MKRIKISWRTQEIALILCFCLVEMTSAIRLKFGQSAAYTTSNAVRGLALKAGIEAAFKEANDKKDVDGVEFELVGLDDAYSASRAVANAINFTTDPNIFGIVGFHATATTQAALPVINAANFPMVGTATGASFLREPFRRNIINYKAGYGDETALMVEYLINEKKTRRISILMQNDSLGESGRDGVLRALKSNNLHVHSIGYYDRTSVNITSGLNTISSVLPSPEAIIMVSTLVPTTNFMIAAKKIWPDIYYLCMSNIQPEELRNALLAKSHNDTTLLKNFIATQVVPLPTDSSIQVTRNFQAALRVSDPTRTPDFNSFEGYMGARMVIMTIARMDVRNLTRENFIQASYDSGMYNFEGLRCGPLVDYDDPDNTPCNQCMKKVFFITPNAQLEMIYLPGQPYRAFTTCGYQPYQWQFIRFGQTCDMTSNGSLCPDYVTGINAAIKEINDAGGIRGVKLAVTTLDDKGNHTNVVENIRSFTSNTDIFGLVGVQDANALVTANRTSLPMFAPLSGNRLLRKPFQKSILNFRASLDDEVGSLVTELYRIHRITKFALIYDDSDVGHSGRQAVINGLSSKRLFIYAEGAYSVYLNDTENGLENITRHSFDGPPEALFVFGPHGSVASLISRANKVWPMSYFLVTSMTHHEHLISYLRNISSSLSVLDRVILSQTVPHYGDHSIEMNENFKTAISVFDSNFVATFASFEGYLMIRFLARTIAAQVEGRADRQSFVDNIYQNGIIDISGIRCGPFEATSCNQALRNVWLNSVTSKGTIVPLKMTVYNTCGFIPDANLDFQLHSLRFGFIFVASIGILITFISIIVLLIHRQKNWIKPNLISHVLSATGCILGYAVIFTLTPIPTSAICTAREWILHLAFAMTFCPMFIRTWRISRIFNNKMLRKIKITDKEMGRQLLAILCTFIVGLLIVTISDPPYVGEAWTNDNVRYEVCQRKNEYIVYLMYTFHLGMLLWGSMLCYRVQGINGQWAYLNESKMIAICIYNASFLEVIAAVFNNHLDKPNQLYIVNSVILLICTSIVLGVTCFVPISKGLKSATTRELVIVKYLKSQIKQHGCQKSSTVVYSSKVISEG